MFLDDYSKQPSPRILGFFRPSLNLSQLEWPRRYPCTTFKKNLCHHYLTILSNIVHLYIYCITHDNNNRREIPWRLLGDTHIQNFAGVASVNINEHDKVYDTGQLVFSFPSTNWDEFSQFVLLQKNQHRVPRLWGCVYYRILIDS